MLINIVKIINTLSPIPYSDGGARTGVFMAIDSNLELHEEDGKFDLYGYLKKMRQARRGLIETVVSHRFQLHNFQVYLIWSVVSYSTKYNQAWILYITEVYLNKHSINEMYN